MRIYSLSGKRWLSVACETRDRVMRYIQSHPGKTVVEYAHETLVAEVAINLIIGQYLLREAANGAIAITPRGRRPEWLAHVPDPLRVPRREPRRRLKPVALPGITEPSLRDDYRALIEHYNDALDRRRSPARRQIARSQFADRVAYIGESHQDTIDRTGLHVDRLESELINLREAVQQLATTVKSQVPMKSHA